MSGRPPQLFPLFAGLDTLDGVGPKTSEHFLQMGITRPRDLIFTLPQGIIDRRRRDSVAGATAGSVVTVAVKVLRHQKPAQKGRPYRIIVEDARTTLSLVWFRPKEGYLIGLLPVGAERLISGKLEIYDGLAQIAHPDHVLPLDEAATIPDFEPVYPLTAGLGARAMIRSVTSALQRVPDLDEWIDPALKAQHAWPNWRDAVLRAHDPAGPDEVSPRAPARERLAYDELFAHQMTLALGRARARSPKGRRTTGAGVMRRKVLAALDFAPTAAQSRAVDEITQDMASDRRMYRLLQGDVGSGKTLVALLTLVAAVEAGGQGVLMAPTEILARQHLDSLSPLASAAGCRIEVLTGRDTGAARAEKLAALAAGDIEILVGTHAVFQADVKFADLRLAIVDEQHRFGVRQRLELGEKGDRADFLVMTATPIPRSLALTQYGDLDLSVLDEKPPGRKPVKTALVGSDRLDSVIEHLRRAVADGQQAYWVCPLVDESEAVPMIAAEQRFALLRAAFPEGEVGLVHGQMPPDRKDSEMARFVGGQTKVLVATTVIEVGVNVPAASIMVIEQAESFGMAQLHQLRGRVGRGATQSTCLLLYHAPLSETATRRLKLLRDTEDGFRIAEEDLAIRGAGDVIGLAQSGIPRFRVADLETQSDLMAIAQTDARAFLVQDPDLSGSRGQAVRTLLWLLEQDKALKLINFG